MSLIRKHAAPFALLAAIAAAAAAPYLVPGDPDAAVFRGGALPSLLLLLAFLPAGGALRRASGRTLLSAALFGLLFSLALSLGAELTFYGELLPGRGSLLRRAAVPLLAAPLLSLLAARIMTIRPAARPRPGASLLPFAALLLALWTPVLLAYWPGMLNYDFAGEYAQHTAGAYSALHPLLHSALMNGALALGERLAGKDAALLALTLLQMALFALALGRACAFAARRLGLRAAVPMLLFFGLHPVFSTLACSMTKDTLFSAALLTLSLDAYALAAGETKGGALFVLRFALCTASVALMRSNGFVALVLLLPGLVAAARGARIRAALCCLAGMAASAVLLLALNLALRPESFPSFQFYSLPAQQLVRARAAGTLTDAEKAELEGWYTDPAGLAVHPHLADPAKGYLDRARLESEGDEFLSLWRGAAKAGAKPYAEAFLLLNIGSWYPDDRSHATIYPDVSWNDKGYLQTQELAVEGFTQTTLLPRFRAFMERICRRNEYRKLPLVPLLFSPATPFWALLFACLTLIARGHGRLSAAALGALALWAGYLLGPCTLARYALPLFCLAPPMLAAAFASEDRFRR